jgi:hypothetical protein
MCLLILQLVLYFVRFKIAEFSIVQRLDQEINVTFMILLASCKGASSRGMLTSSNTFNTL